MDKWTDIQLASIAAAQTCSLEKLAFRWVINTRQSYYILGPSGRYTKPVGKNELYHCLRTDLVRVPSTAASPAGMDWNKIVAGKDIKKTVDEILNGGIGYNGHCSHARLLVADLTLRYSLFDESNPS